MVWASIAASHISSVAARSGGRRSERAPRASAALVTVLARAPLKVTARRQLTRRRWLPLRTPARSVGGVGGPWLLWWFLCVVFDSSYSWECSSRCSIRIVNDSTRASLQSSPEPLQQAPGHRVTCLDLCSHRDDGGSWLSSCSRTRCRGGQSSVRALFEQVYSQDEVGEGEGARGVDAERECGVNNKYLLEVHSFGPAYERHMIAPMLAARFCTVPTGVANHRILALSASCERLVWSPRLIQHRDAEMHSGCLKILLDRVEST